MSGPSSNASTCGDPLPFSNKIILLFGSIDNTDTCQNGASPKEITDKRVAILVDQLDCQNEESFTLETFENLISYSYNENKHFILARATTSDPNDQNKIYYSYYSAHQINKVLFKTEKASFDRPAYLHRMMAKNPLNNMPIIGDVEYFVVSPENFELAHLSCKKRNEGAAFENDKAALESRADIKASMMIEESEEPKIAPTGRGLLLNSWTFASLDWLGLSPRNNTHSDLKRPQYQSYTSCFGYPAIVVDADPKLKKIDSDGVESMGMNTTSDHQSPHSFIHPKKSLSEFFCPAEKVDERCKIENILLEQQHGVIQMDKEKRKACGTNIVFYHAQYFANDEDFLRDPVVRSFFGANSLYSDNAFFEYERDESWFIEVGPTSAATFLQQSQSQQLLQPNEDGLFPGYELSPGVCSFCGILSYKTKSFRRNFFIASTLFYLITSIALLSLLIPDSLRGVIGIAMVIGLCAILILFIEDDKMAYNATAAAMIAANRQQRTDAHANQ